MNIFLGGVRNRFFFISGERMLILKRDYRGFFLQYVRKDFEDYFGVRGVLERKFFFFLIDLVFEVVSGLSMFFGIKSDRILGLLGKVF